MNESRVDAIIQYALAEARRAHDEDRALQDLGPIHLVKYVYLADLAYSLRHGATFTGVEWRFHHFGPWAVDVFERLDAATNVVCIERKRIPSRYEHDFVRWRIPDFEDAERLRAEVRERLPLEVRGAVQRAVREFGNATNELLHYVYATAPMTTAAPGDALEFRTAEPAAEYSASAHAEGLSLKARRRRAKRLEEARQRLAGRARERINQRAEQLAAQSQPRYDEVFDEGTRMLDELAGAPLDVEEGILEFDDRIWKSSARSGTDDE